MNNSTLFTNKQKELLLNSLKMYLEFSVSPLKPELKSSLILSSIEKLENLSVFTSFSKQEFTIMYMALYQTESYLCEVKTFSEKEFYELMEKVYKLAKWF